jgi:hypothetical protein
MQRSQFLLSKFQQNRDFNEFAMQIGTYNQSFHQPVGSSRALNALIQQG